MSFFQANRCKYRSVIFAVSCLIFHTACSEKSDGLLLSDDVERPVDYQKNTEFSTLGQGLNSPFDSSLSSTFSSTLASSDVNFPTATWSAPVNVFSSTVPTNENSEIYGPVLSVSDTANHFISIHQNNLYNPVTGGFVVEQGLSLSNEAGQDNWATDLPYALGTPEGTSNLQIKINEVASGAYAIWIRNGSLYISHKLLGDVWQPAVLIWRPDSGVADLRMLELLVDANGDAWVVWVNGTEVNINQFIAIDTTGVVGLQQTQTIIVENALVYAKPVISLSGVTSISWVSIPVDPFDPNLLQLVQYLPNNLPVASWGGIETAKALNTANPMSAHLSMVVAIDEILMAISQDAFGRTFAVRFDPAASVGNRFTDWENVDYNIGRNDIIGHSAKIVSNLNDNVMIIWSEELFTNPVVGSIESQTSIYTNKYDPVGDANGVHWPAPELVGTTNIRIDPNAVDQVNFKTFPLIKMMPDGRAVAAWVDSSLQSSALFVNHYVSGTGWAAIPDQIISYELFTEGVIRSADIAITPTNNTFITWQQLTKSEFSKEYNFWISDTQL